jgi:CubicO group peptidase (beta-lactamase class C family)
LNASLLELAYTPIVSVSDSHLCDYQRRPNTYYAMGWFVDKTPGFPTKVYHTGDNGGYQAYLAKYPSENLFIAVLENRNDKDRWSMAVEIDRILKECGILK